MSRTKHPFSSGILLSAVTCGLLLGCVPRRDEPTTIRVRWAHDPEVVDPLQLNSQPAIDVANLLHVGLLQIDLPAQRFAPALAETLPAVELIGDSLMRLRYRLRPTAAWDTGRPVLASDVAFTLKLLFCPGLPNEAARAQYGFIRGLIQDPTDGRRFAIECRGQALENLSNSGDFPVLSEAALDPMGRLRRFSLAALQHRPATAPPDSALEAVARRYRAFAPGKLPGCGPYQLTAWVKDRYLTLRRKPHWWASQLRPVPLVLQARPARLEFVVIPDATTASLALQRGELDLLPQVPAREFARLRGSAAARKRLNFYTAPSFDVVTVSFNTRRAVLADARTRRALNRCFDTAGLLQATQLGEGRRAVGIITPADSLNYNDSLALVPYDLPGAAALLRQAGWQRRSTPTDAWTRTKSAGERQILRLGMYYRADETTFATIALQFQAAAARLGIAVALHPTESGALSTTLHDGDFDLCLRILRGNPLMFNFMPMLHSRALGTGNISGFSTPASDHLLEDVAAAVTPARKALLLHRFQAMLQVEAPMAPLFFLSTRVAADRRLRGLHVTGLKPGYVLTTIERVPLAGPAR